MHRRPSTSDATAAGKWNIVWHRTSSILRVTETKRKQAENCERLVRERAYYLWIDAGCPEGRADEFWFAAEDQLRQMLRDATNVGKLLAQS